MNVGRLIHIVLVICFWGVVITSYVLWRVRERRNAKQEAKERQPIIEGLLHPDWEFYERHLQRPAPAALRELYSDMALITAAASYQGKREGINMLWPLNADYLFDNHAEIGHDIVPFATSGCGDSIFLRPGPNEPDTVYIAYHDDPGYVEVFADSVTEILEKARGLKRAA